MLQNTTFHCHYIDHSFYSARSIGSIYSTIPDKYKNRKDSIMLATCQRIEIYTLSAANPLAELDLPFRHIAGRQNVKNRLIAISAGVESQILGEKNVFYQVKNAIRDVEGDNELKSLFEEAIQEGQCIRNEKKFFADMNYEDISLAILQDVLPEGAGNQMGLVIVGSGMLARNFLGKDIFSLYKNVKFITRSPRNLKKKFEKELKKSVLRSNEFIESEQIDYHCIIATNGLEKDGYADEVRPILLSDGCKAVFDLSAAPLFQEDLQSVFYADTYSDVYFEHVDTYNERKRVEAQIIKDEIEATELALASNYS